MPEIKLVTINGKEIELSPLRMKQLKQITTLLASSSKTTGFKALERWLPFILESIKVKQPDFTQDDLEELTIDEFSSVWAQLVSISGIQLVAAGEQKPAADTTASTLQKSTEDSAPVPAKATVN